MERMGRFAPRYSQAHREALHRLANVEGHSVAEACRRIESGRAGCEPIAMVPSTAYKIAGRMRGERESQQLSDLARQLTPVMAVERLATRSLSLLDREAERLERQSHKDGKLDIRGYNQLLKGLRDLAALVKTIPAPAPPRDGDALEQLRRSLGESQ